MQLLVIGGTSFLGRAVVADALARGYDVTTFNRGRSGADADGVRALRGDRAVDADLDQLDGLRFDGVVDTCGFVPAVVGKGLRRLAGSGAHYVFVSSLSASAQWPAARALDAGPGHDCPADAGPDDGDYGVLKAGCERAVTQAFGARSLNVRSGLLIGPHENVGRLPWWLGRIARGGKVLAPGDPDVPMQLVDARDLAAFLLGAIETGLGGTLNATGPAGNATMGSWLGDCVEAVRSRPVDGSDPTDARLTWVADAVLLAEGVEPWTELPLWMPPGQDADYAWRAETAAAEAGGLRARPVRETVRDTWDWLASGGAPGPRRASGLPDHGIDPDKESRILEVWHAQG